MAFRCDYTTESDLPIDRNAVMTIAVIEPRTMPCARHTVRRGYRLAADCNGKNTDGQHEKEDGRLCHLTQ